jgi:O-methyltransferase
MTPEQAALREQEAMQAAARGQTGEAIAQLQSLVRDLERWPGPREFREEAYKQLLLLLYRDGRYARMSKVFRQYVDEHCEDQDPGFDNAYLAGVMASGTPPVPLRRRTRFLYLVRQLEKTLPLEGRVAECGCFRGLSSYVMCSRLRAHDPAFDGSGYEIYDSFQGLSEATAQDTETTERPDARFSPSDMKPGKYAATLEHVRRSLSPFPRISFNPGWIPSAFPAAEDNRYRFVHVDVDLYQPTLDSFEYFWPRLVPGGIIVCDDYNWPGAKRAVEEFCARNSVAFQTTPQTQAWFSRPA